MLCEMGWCAGLGECVCALVCMLTTRGPGAQGGSVMRTVSA